MKSEWLDRRLRVNASVFYLDWRNLQLEAYRFLVPGNLQSKFALTANIDRARGEGAELEITGRVTPKFTLSAALGYLDTKIQESPLISSPAGTSPISLGCRFRRHRHSRPVSLPTIDGPSLPASCRPARNSFIAMGNTPTSKRSPGDKAAARVHPIAPPDVFCRGHRAAFRSIHLRTIS